MNLPLTHLTLAWTFHAEHPDDPPNLDEWLGVLSDQYGGLVHTVLQRHNLPTDATHVNWAVALATVSNGFGANAQLNDACAYLLSTGIGDAPFSPAAMPPTPSDGGTLSRVGALQPSARDTASVEDGRYRGGNQEVTIELRVDRAGAGVVSGDVFRLLAGERHYVASFRTAPGLRIDFATAEWPIIGQDEADRRVQGRLSLAPQTDPPGSLVGRLILDAPLEGLPARRAIPFVAERAGSSFRTLGLEIELEERVAPLGSYAVGDRRITVEDALGTAGIETYTTGIQTSIPRNADGWSMAQLHALMSDIAQASLSQRAWEIHLLVLSKSDRSGLLGVMFDSSDALQRQGTAVFADEIRGIQGIDPDRKLIQTTVHELGHALNLAHRFERVVGRADSTSFMNYDWRYRGGNRSSEFWNRFQFTFDPDELEFLRHAPLPPLIPGGAPFHSIAYWADGQGGYSPYVPEAPLAGFQMALKVPVDPPLLAFAQPVMLEVALTNNSGRALTVPSFLLDPKAGFIELIVRRVNTGAFAPGGTQSLSFVPVMQRCFEWDAADAIVLEHGQTMADNVNLTFGSGGFAFAEPGTYEVTALLVIFDERNQRELVARSNTVRLRIASPKTNDEERDAMLFFSDEVGMYLALGGSPALEGARQKLAEIVDRRKHDVGDALVAHITRAMAIDATRQYVRYVKGKFETHSAQLPEAVKLFDELEQGGMQTFDASTLRSTNEIAKRSRAALEGKAMQQSPVVPRVYRSEDAPVPADARTSGAGAKRPQRRSRRLTRK
jgi:hypothetical protein